MVVLNMASGGSRARSRQPDPNSERSLKRGLSYVALPVDGYQGEVPAFPMDDPVYYYKNGEDAGFVDGETSSMLARIERRIWEWLWRTPQAAAWAAEPWRIYTVAQYTRVAALCETGVGAASDRSVMLRFADEIGLTGTGLTRNGWSIGKTLGALDEEKEEREERRSSGSGSSRGRLKVVAGGKR